MIRPSGFDLYFIYRCPTCNSELWYSSEKVKMSGQVVECCNQLFKLEKMSSFTINCQFGSIIPNENVRDKAVAILKNSGYSEQEANKLTENCKHTKVEDMVRAALSKVVT